MNKELETLKAMKKIIDLDDENIYYITVTNKETKYEGTALFTDENKIMVHEDSETGEKDSTSTYEEFIKRYQFRIMWF